MTAESIMSFRVVKLKPTDKVCDALEVMHTKQIRNLPVVDDDDQFIGIFGIRSLIRLLLPRAAQVKYGLTDLNFLPDEVGVLYERLEEVGQKPVSEFLEKKKNLVFCKPSTSFPEVLELLHKNTDSSLPVIVLKGKHKRLVGMVSSWDVLEKLVLNLHSNCNLDGKTGIDLIHTFEDEVVPARGDDSDAMKKPSSEES